MPTHGAGTYLAEAVESVRAQTWSNWDLVIVCDGRGECTATAERLARADARVRTVHQPHGGVASARNRGLSELSAEVKMISFLDHDDKWLNDTLDVLMRTLAASPDTMIGVHGIGRYIDGAGQSYRPGEMEKYQRQRQGIEGGRVVEWARTRPTSFANLAFSNCIPVGSLLVRRDALHKVGLFDLQAVPADDYDMWTRLSRCGDFAFVDRVVMEYRRATAPTWIRPREGVPYVRRKILTSDENTVEQALIARRGYRLCAKWTVAESLCAVARLAKEKRYAAAARMMARSVGHAAAYVRGTP
jgi:glycosyltransferase involved in cell wall biosynthesis